METPGQAELAFPAALHAKFVRLALDQPTLDFLQGPPPSDAREKNSFADRTRMTNTDRIALLQTHAMHVISTAQVRTTARGKYEQHVGKSQPVLMMIHPIFSAAAQVAQLLGRDPGAAGAAGHLLDIGAGSGAVTAQMAPLFAQVTTTEISVQMAARLRDRGYDCVPATGGGDGKTL
jgi:hypothetical protein